MKTILITNLHVLISRNIIASLLDRTGRERIVREQCVAALPAGRALDNRLSERLAAVLPGEARRRDTQRT